VFQPFAHDLPEKNFSRKSYRIEKYFSNWQKKEEFRNISVVGFKKNRQILLRIFKVFA
jgi:hypothetical protein